MSEVGIPTGRDDGFVSARWCFVNGLLAHPMQVLALVPSIHDTSPGQRYRIEQWQGGLKQSGVEITFAAFEDKKLNTVLYASKQWLRKGVGIAHAFLRRLSTISQSNSYDMVYVFREASLLGP